VPCTAIWFGIMSVPFFTYLTFFFQNPKIALYDFRFVYRRHEFYIVLFGLILYLYSLIYHVTHRKQLIRKGPYRFMRHPQYVALIIMTFGMTLIAFQTSPIFNFNIGNLNGYTVLLYIWIGEVLAYIILGKIEEIALKARYGDDFTDYVSKVSFMIPFLKLKRIKTERK
ncbi:MAG: methyltransferase family protein, partial [Promethearchaeota archaeon]